MAGFDGENGPNVYFLANSQKQSRILYEESKAMIEASPWLKERFVPNVSEIRYPKTNGKIVAMSAEKITKMEKIFILAYLMKFMSIMTMP